METELLIKAAAIAPGDETREMLVLLTGYLSYRALLGRRDALHLTLRPDENERLAELERVFAPLPFDDPHRVYLPRLNERTPLNLPVSFRDPADRVLDGRLRNISTSGFFVETPHARAPGDRVTFRFHDEAAGMDWHFAGEVRRVRGGPGGGMGLCFVGVPVEVHHRRPTGPDGLRGGGPLPFAA